MIKPSHLKALELKLNNKKNNPLTSAFNQSTVNVPKTNNQNRAINSRSSQMSAMQSEFKLRVCFSATLISASQERLLKTLHSSELQCKANDKRAKHCYNSQCTSFWGNPLMLSYSQSSDSGQLRQTYSKSNLKQRGEGGQENPGGWRDSHIDILFMRYDQRLGISEFIFALLVFKPIRRYLPSPLHPKKKKGKFEHCLVTVLRLF